MTPHSATPLSLLLHSPHGPWERQLRARLRSLPARWLSGNFPPPSSLTEPDSLLTTGSPLTLSAYPIAVIDFQGDDRLALQWLEWLDRVHVGALTLALDPRRLPDLSQTARELGATYVWSGPAAPPEVAKLLERWARIALERAALMKWRDPMGAVPGEAGSPDFDLDF